jgi:hypothetical protein
MVAISPYPCITCSVKTTIDFPDDLLLRAKLAAVQRKTTLREIVLQGVDYVLTHAVPVPNSDAGCASTPLAALSPRRKPEPVGRVSRGEIDVHSAEHEEQKRKAAMKRLLQAMKAANTEPMVPLRREEIYDR